MEPNKNVTEIKMESNKKWNQKMEPNKKWNQIKNGTKQKWNQIKKGNK
jgi:hypothetical protein